MCAWLLDDDLICIKAHLPCMWQLMFSWHEGIRLSSREQELPSSTKSGRHSCLEDKLVAGPPDCDKLSDHSRSQARAAVGACKQGRSLIAGGSASSSTGRKWSGGLGWLLERSSSTKRLNGEEL